MSKICGTAAGALATLALATIALNACATADNPLGPQPDAPPSEDANPDAVPDGSPDATPDALPDSTPDATPDAVPDAGPGDACANAQNITAAAWQPGGTTINGDTSGGQDNVLTPNACTGYAADGADDVYAITVVVGDRVVATLTPTSAWDPSLELVAACGEVSCLAGADSNFEGQAETLQHTFAAAGTYYVVADGYNPGVTGPYALTVVITHP